MEFLIAMIVLFAVLFFSLSVHYLRKDQQTGQKAALIKKLKPDPGTNAPLLKGEKKKTRLAEFLGGFFDLAVLETLLVSSESPLSLERFISLSVGSALIFMLPMVLIFRNTVAALVLLPIGAALPFFYLVHRRRKRDQALVRQLPDALDMIVRALRVGQSVNGALEEVATSMPAPVGTEVRMIYEEMTMGLSFEQALRNFETRFTHVTDIKIMCTAFIIQRETGGNLTRTLAGLAHTIRSRFQLKRQIKALTAEGRSSALILGLLPVLFAGITYTYNPGYVGILFHHPIGRKLLLAAVVLVTAGFTVMRIMTRIKV